MDRDVASALIALAVAMDEPLGKMTELVERIEDEATREFFKRAVGNLMGAIFAEIIFPIEKIYPDLNPDKA